MEITLFLFQQYKMVQEERERFLQKYPGLDTRDCLNAEDVMKKCFYGINNYQLRIMRRYLKKAEWSAEIAWRKYNRTEMIHPRRVEQNKKKRIMQFIFGK